MCDADIEFFEADFDELDELDIEFTDNLSELADSKIRLMINRIGADLEEELELLEQVEIFWDMENRCNVHVYQASELH